MDYKREVGELFDKLPDGEWSDVLSVCMLLTAYVFDAGERNYANQPMWIEAMPASDTMRRRYKITIEEIPDGKFFGGEKNRIQRGKRR